VISQAPVFTALTTALGALLAWRYAQHYFHHSIETSKMIASLAEARARNLEDALRGISQPKPPALTVPPKPDHSANRKAKSDKVGSLILSGRELAGKARVATR
jgi:uncharacterized membrane protein